MVQIALAFVATALVSVQASPFFSKRIAQTINQSTVKWEAACNKASKNSLRESQCNKLAVAAFDTLLATAGPCAQQDGADGLMDLSKSLKSNEMIKHAQIFAQQPRNSPDSLFIPYCQKSPRNRELNGLFQCQYMGSKKNVFVGKGKNGLGATGTIPFNMGKPVTPPGSCPAHPQGPIADGTQLSDIVTKPVASGRSIARSDDTVVPNTPSTSGGNSLPSAPSAPSPAKLDLKFSTLDSNSPCDVNETLASVTDFPNKQMENSS